MLECLAPETRGQTDLLNEDQPLPHMNQLLAHVPRLMLTFCSSPQETAASRPGQEERREAGEKNSLQEPPLPPQSEWALNT